MANQYGQRVDHSLKPIAQCSKSKNQDISALQLPIETTVTGLKQAFSVLVNGHPDIADLLVSEANVIYECRSCLNFYRCITSFISHKRYYCKKRSSWNSNTTTENGRSQPGVTLARISDQNIVRLVQEPEDVGLKLPEFNLNDYRPSFDLMKDLDLLRQTGVKKSLESVVQSIRTGGKPDSQTNYFRDKIDELEHKEMAKKFNFAEFYEKRLNPKWKTAVLDPTGKIIQPGPPTRQFEQNMTSYRDEFNRAIRSQANIYPCPKCGRRFLSVKKTTDHLSAAHALSQSTSLGYSTKILRQRIPVKSVQPESFESIVRKTSVVYITINDSRAANRLIDRQMIDDHTDVQDQDKEQISIRKLNGFICHNPNLSLLPKSKISNSMFTSTKPSRLSDSDAECPSKTPETSEPLGFESRNHFSDKVLKTSMPNVILEPLSMDLLKPLIANTPTDSKDQQSLVGVRSTRRSPVSLNSSDIPEKDHDQGSVNGENSEPRKCKRKQSNPTLVVQAKVGPSSGVRSRKRPNPTHIPVLSELKRLRVPLA